MNTEINYVYTDASGYHVHNRCVVEGEISLRQIQNILEACDGGEFFIPEEVGLPARTFVDEGYAYDPEEDHPWFSLGADSFELTAEAPTVKLSASELADLFAACQWS